MDFGTIKIVNDGTRAEPSWSVVCRAGHLTDNKSLDTVVEWLYGTIAEGNTFNGLRLDLGDDLA